MTTLCFRLNSDIFFVAVNVEKKINEKCNSVITLLASVFIQMKKWDTNTVVL